MHVQGAGDPVLPCRQGNILLVLLYLHTYCYLLCVHTTLITFVLLFCQVMIHLGVREIPRLHVMPRWTAKPLQCQMHCRGEPRTDTCQQCRHSAMHDQFIDLARLACEDDRCYEIVMRGIGKLNRDLAAAEAVPRRRSTKPASRKPRRKR